MHPTHSHWRPSIWSGLYISNREEKRKYDPHGCRSDCRSHGVEGPESASREGAQHCASVCAQSTSHKSDECGRSVMERSMRLRHSLALHPATHRTLAQTIESTNLSQRESHFPERIHPLHIDSLSAIVPWTAYFLDDLPEFFPTDYDRILSVFCVRRSP